MLQINKTIALNRLARARSLACIYIYVQRRRSLAIWSNLDKHSKGCCAPYQFLEYCSLDPINVLQHEQAILGRQYRYTDDDAAYGPVYVYYTKCAASKKLTIWRAMLTKLSQLVKTHETWPFHTKKQLIYNKYLYTWDIHFYSNGAHEFRKHAHRHLYLARCFKHFIDITSTSYLHHLYISFCT